MASQSANSALAERINNWRRHLHDVEPIVNELVKHGCTRGEALMLIEMNGIAQGYLELEAGLLDLSRVLDALVEGLNNDEGEGWKGKR